MNLEASKMRALARNGLLEEEKEVVEAGILRDRQAAEGRRLLEERKHDLEELEKRFQLGKPQVRTEREDDSPKEEQETPRSLSEDPMDYYKEIFDVLKEVTGGSNIDEVCGKFKAQKETQEQLAALRKKSEEDKNRLEQVQEKYVAELERWKFVESKDVERNSADVDAVLAEIDLVKGKLDETNAMLAKVEASTKAITKKLASIYHNYKPGDIESDALDVLEFLRGLFEDISRRELSREQVDDLDLQADKWLPAQYNGIMRRTPLPQLGSPTPIPPPGSDEEEEVPSRGFLKRQAQLVVDAKTKRKNIRFPLPKTR